MGFFDFVMERTCPEEYLNLKYRASLANEHRQVTPCVHVYMKRRESMRVMNKALKIAHLNR